MEVTPIRANQCQRQRWKNGFGWTLEIYRYPEGGQDWDFRVSVAEVEQDAPFSAFEHCDREIVLLAGNGMRLCFDDGEAIDLLPPHGRHRFAGERPLHAQLLDGPTRDFNLMWRRDRCEAELWHRPLVGTMVIFREAGVQWLVYVLAGQARLSNAHGEHSLAQGDSALIVPGEDESHRCVLDGGGEVLLVKVKAI